MGLSKSHGVHLSQACDNHTELLNIIAKKIRAKYYLEIGVKNPIRNFDKIDVLLKIGVDPDPRAMATVCKTSDDFFEKALHFGESFDLVWIDGLHRAEQVRKDIINSWQCIRPGGVIAIHDCNPFCEEISLVPRETKVWTGDVYKAVCNVRNEKFTIDFDYGCCILRKPSLVEVGSQRLLMDNTEISWNEFNTNRTQLLNLVSLDHALNLISQWT